VARESRKPPLSGERIERIGIPEGYWPGAPDLAIEVVSPGDTYTAVEDKVMEWLGAGTRMVAVINRSNIASRSIGI
jgi:Uma2 family endonuclease